MKKNSVNLNYWPLVLFFSLSIITSCVDEPLEGRINNNDRDIKELTASSGFEWKTSRMIEVNLKGLPFDVGIERKLTFGDGKGSLFFSGRQAMNENYKMEFELPAHITEVTMVYGEILKTGEIVEGKVFFDFLSIDNEEDIEN